MLRLLVCHGTEELTFPVPESEATLGRDPENAIALPFAGVSRRHAIVRRIPGGVEIVDQSVKNNLFAGGEKVRRAILTPGLRVQIGTAWLEVEEVSSEAALLFARESSAAGAVSA